ncbi:putative surface protein with fasciclin (FAS1) repeats [Chitinophaga skermanii]|uniref:Putative surface protein with fasciclin (FAS1) repeats n=1 Tax=Chitinophaga skermanii TaxID=331697 RepID=A0A327R4C5_9BACT|nr:fasciclin domain-containing protein [Chitinophaga skermanii]RAJ08737.1 putative surface protein with fasciclin (FAS1) repeats [Chitinophaga skermanii]
MKHLNIVYIGLVSMLLCGASACKHDDITTRPVNLNYRPGADFIKNNYDLTIFSALIDKSGMKDELNGAGPYTFIAPNDKAFTEIGLTKDKVATISEDSAKHIVQYHVITRRLMTDDIPANGVDVRYATLYDDRQLYVSNGSYSPGQEIDPTKNRKEIYFNGSLAIKKDVTVLNGNLYVTDKVMKYTPGDMQAFLADKPELSILVAGFKKFGYWDKLKGLKPFTILAPTNAVFEKAGMTEAFVNAMNTNEYYGTRLFGVYLMQGNRYFVNDFSVFRTITGVNGITVLIDPSDTWSFSMYVQTNTYTGLPTTMYITIRTALQYPYEEVKNFSDGIPANYDFLTDNGILHKIETVIVLPSQAKR